MDIRMILVIVTRWLMDGSMVIIQMIHVKVHPKECRKNWESNVTLIVKGQGKKCTIIGKPSNKKNPDKKIKGWGWGASLNPQLDFFLEIIIFSYREMHPCFLNVFAFVFISLWSNVSKVTSDVTHKCLESILLMSLSFCLSSCLCLFVGLMSTDQH